VTDASPGWVAELCGLPGVGKTYVAGRLREHCGRLGVRLHAADATVGAATPVPRRTARKAALVTTQVLTRPVPSAHAVAAIAGSRQPHPRNVVSWCVQWLIAQRLLAAARRAGGAHLFDEGPLQALWSIGLRGDVAGLLRPETHRLLAPEVPDLLVVIDAPLDTIARRLTARPSQHSRTQRLPPAERCAELTRGQDLLDRLVEWRRSPAGGTVPVVYVRNLDSGPRAGLDAAPDDGISRAAEVIARAARGAAATSRGGSGSLRA
jgi:hypothetical protein